MEKTVKYAILGLVMIECSEFLWSSFSEVGSKSRLMKWPGLDIRISNIIREKQE